MSGDELRRAMGELVGVPAEHVTLFWRGRVALYAIMRALGIGPGDEVILPAFTCVAVPNAILYTGARPVYADIDERTYTLDLGAVAAAAGPRTRAIVAQNTFGLSCDLDGLTAVAARHGAVVLDDCTHGLGGTYRGRPNGASARAAFYSTQWSKPISTGLGGIAVTGDPDLARELRAIERAARGPGTRDQALLRALVFARERIATPRTVRSGRAVYRSLGRAGVIPGSSNGAELAGPEIPASFLTRMSPFQAGLGARRLRGVADAVLRRRATAGRYTEWLAGHGRAVAGEPPFATHAYLRYPLRVRERDRMLALARRRGIELGDWFDSPLHPIRGDLSPWGYAWGTNPVAERVVAEIVNLPTDVDASRLGAVQALLDASLPQIL